MLQYEIKEHLGVIEESAGGWRTELNHIAWNGKPAKLDLRPWNEDHSKMGKGITLTEEAADALMKLLQNRR